MKYIIVFIMIAGLYSCTDNSPSFRKKDFYEEITGIKFPRKYKILETYVYSEILTVTVLSVDHSTLKKFVTDNHFDTLQHVEDLRFYSSRFLENYKAEFKTAKDIYFIDKTEGNHNWGYVVDLNANILWAEIFYPPGEKDK